MKRLFGLLLLFAAVVAVVVAAAEIDGETEEARARVAFSSYETRFGKHYSTDEERARRFELYKKRAATWPELRARFPETGFGETMFTDLTDEECAAYIGGVDETGEEGEGLEPVPNVRPRSSRAKRATPSGWNWCDSTNNKCSAIVTQGSCGSCWVFGSIAALEIQNAIATGRRYNLSQEQVCNCNTAYDGVCCCGGNAVAVYGTIKDYTSAELYPYTFKNADTDCSNDQKACQSKQIHVVISGYDRQTLPNIDIEDYVFQNGAIALSMYADTANGIYSYTSGFIPCTSNTQHNHLIALVGYNVTEDGTEYYIGRNSWGTNWGIDGYFWAKKSFPCYIGSGSGYRPHVIPYWTCPAANYNKSDGCHCECGAYDPDCGKTNQTLYGCNVTGNVCDRAGKCCMPKTCAQIGKECGNCNDGCGGTINCGDCGDGLECNATNFCAIPQEASGSGAGLSPGAIAGIAIGLALFVAGAAVGVAFLVIRHRKTSTGATGGSSAPSARSEAGTEMHTPEQPRAHATPRSAPPPPPPAAAHARPPPPPPRAAVANRPPPPPPRR